MTDPETGEVIVEQNEEISEEEAAQIEAAGIEEVAIRSVMTCHSKHGICAKCYGRNLATGESVNIGESVGITAAQSIGEPGTQLTMRTFHTGGVAGADITSGLPRVEELFEVRKPKGIAEICEADGTVMSIEPREDNKTEVVVVGEEEKTKGKISEEECARIQSFKPILGVEAYCAARTLYDKDKNKKLFLERKNKDITWAPTPTGPSSPRWSSSSPSSSRPSASPSSRTCASTSA